MNYPLESSRRPSRRAVNRRPVFIIGLIIVIVTLLVIFLFSSFINSGSRKIWQNGSAVGNFFSNAKYYFTDRAELLERIRSLEESNNLITLSLLEKDIILTQHVAFEKEAGLSNESFVGKVIRRSPSLPYDQVIIDIGENEGVKTGMKSYYQGLLVGEVVEVSGVSSRIELYTSSGKTFVAVLVESLYEGEARGMGGGFFSMEVPRDIKVEVGEVVRDQSRESNILGKVEHIEEKQGETLQILYIVPPVPINNIDWLSVRKNI